MLIRTYYLTLTTRKYFCINHREQSFFFKLKSWIIHSASIKYMLWVYSRYKYPTLSVRGSTLDVIIWGLKSFPALKKYTIYHLFWNYTGSSLGSSSLFQYLNIRGFISKIIGPLPNSPSTVHMIQVVVDVEK